jgi:hypothetical protein
MEAKNGSPASSADRISEAAVDQSRKVKIGRGTHTQTQAISDLQIRNPDEAFVAGMPLIL